jgi:hypothetical protein
MAKNVERYVKEFARVSDCTIYSGKGWVLIYQNLPDCKLGKVVVEASSWADAMEKIKGRFNK